ncbi:hypothetical protein ACNOYE_30630 [Nannocystaceae bacterium ST9]
MPELATIVVRNGLWLIVPVMVWNVALAKRLPPAFAKQVFWADIPRTIAIPENLLRVALFALPCVTVIGLDSTHAIGLALFGVGLLAYFASWIALIRAPESRWSRHAIGFMAPAYTPALWLLGMALSSSAFVGDERVIRGLFLGLAAAFLGFHLAHVGLIHRRVTSPH